MRLERHRSLPEWAEAALLSWLPEAELAVSLRASLTSAVAVVDGGSVVTAGVLVEGRGTLSGADLLVACAGDARGAPLLAGAVEQEARRDGGVELAGPATVARPGAAALADRVGGSVTEVMGQRLMAATRARPPAGVPGRPRRVGNGDHEVVGEWLDDFSVEALGHDRRGVAEWRERLADTDWMLWLWEVDGRPVSLVNARRTTPTSSRLGPVYTPPGERGHGYAGALTAAATDARLAAGDVRVALFTDVANPTSNALYARVGFEDVCAHGSWLVEA